MRARYSNKARHAVKTVAASDIIRTPASAGSVKSAELRRNPAAGPGRMRAGPGPLRVANPHRPGESMGFRPLRKGRCYRIVE